MSKHEDIVTLAIDIHRASQGQGSLGQYSQDQADEALRKALIDVAGTDKIDYKTMRKFQPEIFAILEDTLDILIVEGLTNQFDQFVEIRNMGWGDSPLFMIDDPQLFHVASVADGTKNLRRQNLDAGTLTVQVGTHGLKIMAELYRFLAARISWPKMVQKVSESYNKDVALNIYNAIVAALAALPAPYRVAGAFNENNLLEICDHVSTGTDSGAVIMGAPGALRQVTMAAASDKWVETHNATSFYSNFNGYPMIALKQAHHIGTDDFIIDNDLLMVVPNMRDKFIKLVVEGESLIFQTPAGENMDLSLEYTFIKKYGIAVVHSKKLGVYEIQ